MSPARGALAPVDLKSLLEARAKGLLGDGYVENYTPTLRDRLAELAAGAGRSLGLGDLIAQRMREDTAMGADFLPGVGDAVGADDTARAFNAGNYGEAAVSGAATAAGAIPIGGDIAGGLLKAMFGGVAAKTANRAALETAQKMAKRGADKKAIWDATGWFKGTDGKWRFEIDDSQSRLGDKARDELMAGPGTASGATQRTAPGVIWHNDLYTAYPAMRNVDFDARYNDRLSHGNNKGSFQGDDGTHGGRPQITVQSNSLEGGPRSVRGIGLHELQHGIQDVEDFARGGNNFSVFGHSDPAIRRAVNEEWRRLLEPPSYEQFAANSAFEGVPETEIRKQYADVVATSKKAMKDVYHPLSKIAQETAATNVYKRMAGEVEARNVQTRMNMTAAERRARPPWETQDVPDEMQIVRHR